MRVFSLLFLILPFGGPLDWAGPPKTDPPQLQQKGPPPAWVETATRSVWLAFGSYCWTTMCVDMIPPAMRDDIPRIVAKRGVPVRIHLAFAPRTAHVLVLRGGKQTILGLEPKRLLVWRPRVSGVVLVDVRGAQGSAGYLCRIRVSRR